MDELKPMEQRNDSMFVSYKCMECGFNGEVITEEKKVKCPKCGAVNDVWLKGETPPPNHAEQRNEPSTADIVKALRNILETNSFSEEESDAIRASISNLEQLERDLEALKAFHERYAEQTSKKYVADICALTDRAEKAEAERDAELSKAVRAVLIEIMGRLASFENYFPPCNFCEYENGERVECKQCYENGNFKYRGCAKVKQNKEVEE